MRASKIATLKESYQAAGGSHSDLGSDMVTDYDMGSYRFPQPMSNTAYTPDSSLQVSYLVLAISSPVCLGDQIWS